MPANREPCFAALFALLEELGVEADPTNGVFKLISRTIKTWDDVQSAQAPACFLAKGNETTEQRRGMPQLWRLEADIVIYCKVDEGRDTIPSIQLNEIISLVEGKLERKPTEVAAAGALFADNPDMTFGTTLGGLCYTCAINGTVEVFEGLTGGGSVAIIPVEIITTGIGS